MNQDGLTIAEMRGEVLKRYPGASVEQDDYPRDDKFRVILVLGGATGRNFDEASPRAWADAYCRMKRKEEETA